MSKRRSPSKRSSKSSSSSLPNIPLNQKTILLLAGIVAFVLTIGIAGFIILNNQNQPSDTANLPEEAAGSEAGRRTDTDTGVISPISNLGSGGSISSDWYELHFNSPTYPDKKENHKGGLDTYLVSLINKSTKTLDIADYDFDLLNVADAMVAVKQRGVRVRMVTDTDTVNNTKQPQVQEAFAKLKKAGIPIVDDQRGPIMHNKFTVVDNEWISTGSWNYTDGDTYRLNNNMIIIRNPQLALNYTTEFEKMFVQKQFGPNKAKGVPNPLLTIGGARVQNYFSAEDGVANKIIETLKGAKQSIYFMAFSFTHEGIGQTVRDKAKAGLKVGGVFETTGSNTQYSEFPKMKAQGLDVYTDGNPYVMHHKVFIVDEKTVIFGSFNFSDNADKSNDENLLIVDDVTLAKAFKQEYDRVLEIAKNPPKKKS